MQRCTDDNNARRPKTVPEKMRRGLSYYPEDYTQHGKMMLCLIWRNNCTAMMYRRLSLGCLAGRKATEMHESLDVEMEFPNSHFIISSGECALLKSLGRSRNG